MQIATNDSRTLDNPLSGLDTPIVWCTQSAFAYLQKEGKVETKRTAERRLHALGLLPDSLSGKDLSDENAQPVNPLLLEWALKRSRSKRQLVLYAQLSPLPNGQTCLHANDSRGARYWRPLQTLGELGMALQELQDYLAKEIALFPHAALAAHLRKTPLPPGIKVNWHIFPAVSGSVASPEPGDGPLPRLHQLENESIHILREALAEASRPALLFAGGKESAVLLHLARKACHPSPPPCPLLHIDTRWQFRETCLYRDQAARASGMDLIVHANPEAAARNINPFDHGAGLHREIADAAALRQAIERYRFDLLLTGRRRDEDPWQAKETIFSRRDKQHRWQATQSAPEPWDLYNTRRRPDESMRVFPLANWSELDIWQYIQQQGLALPSLYFARERPVVMRGGRILLVDDARFQLLPGEEIIEKRVRFRSLGCYPLSSAIESDASTPQEIIQELQSRQLALPRPTDNAETMKMEGYY